MIAESGVAGTSHRKVAQAADVPLGSMTYHFTGMNDLLREAFSRFARTASQAFDERMAAAHDTDTAKQAVVETITEVVFSNQRDLVLTQELYTLAAGTPPFATSPTPGWPAAGQRSSSTSNQQPRGYSTQLIRVSPSTEPSTTNRKTMRLVTAAVERITASHPAGPS